MIGVKFNDKHSYDDFGLILTNVSIELPAAKTDIIDVPGMDGSLDLTEALCGEVKYKNRKLSFTFTVIDRINRWASIVSNIANYLHGKTVQVIIDSDRSFYYDGRCTVNTLKSEKRTATIVVDCNVKPYKMDIQSAAEPWEWDAFSLVDGIIHVNNVVLTGESKTVVLLNRRMPVSPVFTCEQVVTLTFNDVNYRLVAGRNHLLDVRLQEGENTLIFNGNGAVAIDYRGGSL